MTNNVLYRSCGLLGCAIIVLIIYVLCLFSKKSKMKTCEANVYYNISSLNDLYTFDGHVLFDMNNNTGYVSLSGKIVDGDETYYLSQDINFDYMAVGEGRYKLLPGKQDTNKYGDVPDDLVMPLYDIMGLSGKSPIFIFAKNRDYIVWGTLNTPVMTCVFTLDH